MGITLIFWKWVFFIVVVTVKDTISQHDIIQGRVVLRAAEEEHNWGAYFYSRVPRVYGYRFVNVTDQDQDKDAQRNEKRPAS